MSSVYYSADFDILFWLFMFRPPFRYYFDAHADACSLSIRLIFRCFHYFSIIFHYYFIISCWCSFFFSCPAWSIWWYVLIPRCRSCLFMRLWSSMFHIPARLMLTVWCSSWYAHISTPMSRFCVCSISWWSWYFISRLWYADAIRFCLYKCLLMIIFMIFDCLCPLSFDAWFHCRRFDDVSMTPILFFIFPRLIMPPLLFHADAHLFYYLFDAWCLIIRYSIWLFDFDVWFWWYVPCRLIHDASRRLIRSWWRDVAPICVMFILILFRCRWCWYYFVLPSICRFDPDDLFRERKWESESAVRGSERRVKVCASWCSESCLLRADMAARSCRCRDDDSISCLSTRVPRLTRDFRFWYRAHVDSAQDIMMSSMSMSTLFPRARVMFWYAQMFCLFWYSMIYRAKILTLMRSTPCLMPTRSFMLASLLVAMFDYRRAWSVLTRYVWFSLFARRLCLITLIWWYVSPDVRLICLFICLTFDDDAWYCSDYLPDTRWRSYFAWLCLMMLPMSPWYSKDDAMMMPDVYLFDLSFIIIIRFSFHLFIRLSSLYFHFIIRLPFDYFIHYFDACPLFHYFFFFFSMILMPIWFFWSWCLFWSLFCRAWCFMFYFFLMMLIMMSPVLMPWFRRLMSILSIFIPWCLMIMLIFSLSSIIRSLSSLLICHCLIHYFIIPLFLPCLPFIIFIHYFIISSHCFRYSIIFDVVYSIMMPDICFLILISIISMPYYVLILFRYYTFMSPDVWYFHYSFIILFVSPFIISLRPPYLIIPFRFIIFARWYSSLNFIIWCFDIIFDYFVLISFHFFFFAWSFPISLLFFRLPVHHFSPYAFSLPMLFFIFFFIIFCLIIRWCSWWSDPCLWCLMIFYFDYVYVRWYFVLLPYWCFRFAWFSLFTSCPDIDSFDAWCRLMFILILMIWYDSCHSTLLTPDAIVLYFRFVHADLPDVLTMMFIWFSIMPDDVDVAHDVLICSMICFDYLIPYSLSFDDDAWYLIDFRLFAFDDHYCRLMPAWLSDAVYLFIDWCPPADPAWFYFLTMMLFLMLMPVYSCRYRLLIFYDYSIHTWLLILFWFWFWCLFDFDADVRSWCLMFFYYWCSDVSFACSSWYLMFLFWYPDVLLIFFFFFMPADVWCWDPHDDAPMMRLMRRWVFDDDDAMRACATDIWYSSIHTWCFLILIDVLFPDFFFCLFLLLPYFDYSRWWRFWSLLMFVSWSILIQIAWLFIIRCWCSWSMFRCSIILMFWCCSAPDAWCLMPDADYFDYFVALFWRRMFWYVFFFFSIIFVYFIIRDDAFDPDVVLFKCYFVLMLFDPDACWSTILHSICLFCSIIILWYSDIIHSSDAHFRLFDYSFYFHWLFWWFW